jgi:hypothetical protein
VNTTGNGTIRGAGTVAGNVVYSGTGNALRPGTAGATGNLTVNGNLTLNDGTTAFFRLNGTTAGTQYDRVTVTGAGSVINLANGTLNLALGYDPAPTDQLFIIDNQPNTSIIGTFNGLPHGTSFNLTNPGTGNTFAAFIHYDGVLSGTHSVVILFQPVPEPAGILALIASAAGLFRLSRRSTSRSSPNTAGTSNDRLN